MNGRKGFRIDRKKRILTKSYNGRVIVASHDRQPPEKTSHIDEEELFSVPPRHSKYLGELIIWRTSHHCSNQPRQQENSTSSGAKDHGETVPRGSDELSKKLGRGIRSSTSNSLWTRSVNTIPTWDIDLIDNKLFYSVRLSTLRTELRRWDLSE